MTRRFYSDEERAAGLAVLDANAGNLARTSREIGVPASTIARWRNAPDRAAPAQVRTQKRDEAADRWARVEDKNLILAEATLDKQLDLPGGPAPDKRMYMDYMRGAGIARDKLQNIKRGDAPGETEVRIVVEYRHETDTIAARAAADTPLRAGGGEGQPDALHGDGLWEKVRQKHVGDENGHRDSS